MPRVWSIGVSVWSASCHVDCSSQMGGIHSEVGVWGSLCGQLFVM